MRIHLLGYSESFISRILDSLADKGETERVTIVTNIHPEENIPFIPPGIQHSRVSWEEWHLEPLNHACFLGVNRPTVKKIVFEFFRKQRSVYRSHYTTIQHPASVVSSTAELEKGCFLEPQTVIASFTTLGFSVSVNRGTTIGHHCIIGDFVTINPGVHIAGHCRIGEGSQVGIGTVIFDRVQVGANTIIGGGSVVTKDLPDNVIAWGNPCKVIRNNIPGT